jgi:NAD(P)-dependent dehydrogenase (short-subunit alcohol dehydrogenase family)
MTAQAPPVAIVTGASQGIGAGLTAAFRERGYAVVGTSRTIAPFDDPLLAAVPGDLAAPGTAERVVAEALDRFGRLDTLVNNAGVFVSKPFTEYTDDDYDLLTGVNLRGFFAITRPAIAHMARHGGGHVLNITTTLVEQADARVPAALAVLTKGGIAAATRSLAIEYAAAGVRVNAVSPGVIKTPMYGPEDYAGLDALHPLGRMGTIADVVGAAMYLESAPFVTGEILHVDGGQSAGHRTRGPT